LHQTVVDLKVWSDELLGDAKDFLVEKGRSEEALAVAESVRARALSEKLGLSQAQEPDFRISDLQQRLPERTVLLVYWTAPRRSLVWVITRNGHSQFHLPDSAQLREVVGRYNQLIVGRKDPLDREYGVEKELYDSVLAPVHKMIPPRASVIVVPDGPLYELNFETILVRNGQPRYWIEDVTISVAPSVHVLGFDSDASHRRRNVLFIGDPIPPSQDFPALAHLKEELAAIERTFPNSDHTTYASERATPDAYRTAHPEKYYAIHFAAHATASPESPLNSAVVLSKKGDDFKLYARDVVNQPIRAALVTVSGCRSAGAKVYSGEGLIGFAWAFLRAGARNVIGGLWDVDDGATAQIMGRLYENLAEGATPAEALRQAKLKLLRSNSLYRKPYFWAPFPIFTRSVAGVRGPTLLSRR
jgi:CHAT domain-containing protein